MRLLVLGFKVCATQKKVPFQTVHQGSSPLCMWHRQLHLFCVLKAPRHDHIPSEPWSLCGGITAGLSPKSQLHPTSRGRPRGPEEARFQTVLESTENDTCKLCASSKWQFGGKRGEQARSGAAHLPLNPFIHWLFHSSPLHSAVQSGPERRAGFLTLVAGLP